MADSWGTHWIYLWNFFHCQGGYSWLFKRYPTISTIIEVTKNEEIMAIIELMKY